MHQVRREQVLPFQGARVVAQEVCLDQVSAPHGHSFLELAVVVAGEGTHTSAAGRYRLCRGSVALILPGEWHGYDDCTGLVVWNLYIAPEVRDKELSGMRGDPLIGRALFASGIPMPLPGRSGLRRARLAVGAIDEEVLASVERLLALLAAHRSAWPGEPATRIGLLLEILGEVCGSLVVDPGDHQMTGAGSHPGLLAAARLLEEHPEQQWSLPDLATRVHLSPAYLVRLFTRELGMPPIAYLTRVRAERAAALLIDSELSVTEIGRLAGWSDPSYASRRFASVFGLSPRSYRDAFRPPAADHRGEAAPPHP